MGTFHRATITPGKAELIAQWAPTQSWFPADDGPVDVIGGYRFDDPDNRVGMETHMVRAGNTLVQVPLTYRDEPVAGAEHGFISEMHHSALGTRWVYDGLTDERYLIMAAAVSMTGQGEALGMVLHEDRWYAAPTNIRISGGGWGLDRVPVDQLGVESDSSDAVVFGNDGFELTFFRRPVVGARPPIGLTATWDAQTDPVILTEVRRR